MGTRSTMATPVIILGILSILVARWAHADDVVIASSIRFTELDVGDGNRDGVFLVEGKLTIADGGRILCDPADPLQIRVVNGDLEILKGGSIQCNDTELTGFDAGLIEIVVADGNLLMEAGSAIRAETGTGTATGAPSGSAWTVT